MTTVTIPCNDTITLVKYVAVWIPSILKTEIGDQYSELSPEYCEKLVQTAFKTIPILDISDTTH